MKEIFSAFGSDAFRTLVTLVLPGAMGLSTWFVLLLQKSPDLLKLAETRSIETGVLLMAVAVALGMVLQNFGSMIEAAVFDRLLQRIRATHTETWYRYLRHAFKTEPVGQSYLRSLVMRLQFELNAAMGLLLAAAGAPCLSKSPSWLPWLLLGLGLNLLREAWHTSDALSRLREELLQGIIVVE